MLAVRLASQDFPEVSTLGWAMQRKVDGRRRLAENTAAGPVGYNRDGELSPLTKGLTAALATLEEGVVLDGEWANGQYHLFDVLAAPGVNAATSWDRRDAVLRQVLDRWSPPARLVTHVPHVIAPEDKLAVIADVQRAFGEGVVFKRVRSRYHPGPTKSPEWRKMKFTEDVDCVIVGANHDGKDNFTLALVDPTGDMILPGGQRGREVGRCSAVTGDGRKATIGDVVTITVTGRGSSGRLVEPVLPRLRHDKAPSECTIDQLDPIRLISR